MKPVNSQITRLARRELRVETEKLKKASAQYRADIADLKRRVVQLERFASQLSKNAQKQIQPQAAPAALNNVRFSAKGLRKLRARLDLSAAALGNLFGLTAQSIYNWEQERTRPNKEQIAAIAVLRKMSKKEVSARLAAI